VFFMLALRLPAYRGVMNAVVARESRDDAPAGRRPGVRRASAGYDSKSAQANNARSADTAPPATAGALAALNASLGMEWFSHKTVPANA